MFPTNSCPLTSSVQQLQQNCKGRLAFASLFLQSPDALSDLTDAEKQFLLFICTFCSSNVIVTYFISFSELSLPFIAPVCDFNRVSFSRLWYRIFTLQPCFWAHMGFYLGPFQREQHVYLKIVPGLPAGANASERPPLGVGDVGTCRQLRGTDRHRPPLRRELPACSAAVLQSVVCVLPALSGAVQSPSSSSARTVGLVLTARIYARYVCICCNKELHF